MTKSKSWVARALFACLPSAIILAGASSVHAGVTVNVDLVPSVLSFSPGSAEYIFGLGIESSGFTDDSNPSNQVVLKSNDNAFSSNAGSNGYGSVSDLNTGINGTGGYTLSLTDGVTHVTSTYSLNITTPGVNPDFVRPIDLTPGPNTTISSTPNFTTVQASSSNPAAQYTSGFSYLIGSASGSQPTTTYGPTSTSFSPVSPLGPDTYTAGVFLQIDVVDPSNFTVTTPGLVSGPDTLDSLTYDVMAVSNSQSDTLTVVPEPASMVFLAAAGLLAVRRRRPAL